MRTISIFGRKMPILAILMAALIVGTASAAVYSHYATLTGTVNVGSPLIITFNDEDVPTGSIATMNLGQVMYPDSVDAAFQYENVYTDSIYVDIYTILYEADGTTEVTRAPDEINVELAQTEPDTPVEYFVSIDMPEGWIINGDHILSIQIKPHVEVPPE